MIEDLRKAAEVLPLPALLTQLLEGTGYLDMYRGSNPEDQARLENIQEFRSAAGMVIAQFGRIPAVGEHFEWGEWSFEVVDLDGVRIDKILVSRIPEES